LRGAAPANDAQGAAAELSKKLIAEIEDADTLVIGAPMYNFGIPSILKTWFDYVLRAGLTFRYTEAGPVGLLHGKRAIVIESRCGWYSDGPAKSMDAQEPHLRALLGSLELRTSRSSAPKDSLSERTFASSQSMQRARNSAA